MSDIPTTHLVSISSSRYNIFYKIQYYSVGIRFFYCARYYIVYLLYILYLHDVRGARTFAYHSKFYEKEKYPKSKLQALDEEKSKLKCSVVTQKYSGFHTVFFYGSYFIIYTREKSNFHHSIHFESHVIYL